MTLKDFLSYTNLSYNSLNFCQRKLVDTIDYAEANNLKIIELKSRNGYKTNIIKLYNLMNNEDIQGR